MSIEKIACPRLNGESICDSRSKKEVVVKFDEDENPTGIMCEEYVDLKEIKKVSVLVPIKEYKYGCRKNSGASCIYQKGWFSLK